MTHEQFIAHLREVLGKQAWPKPLHLLQGVSLLSSDDDLHEVARIVRTTPRKLAAIRDAVDPICEAVGMAARDIQPLHLQRARQMLGQLLLGRCAEMAFEKIYNSEMHTRDFELRDLRESRTDTDYRLYNGYGRPIYRINIKFHGTRFRRAVQLVSLEPQDCFPLATYKIHSALQKQEEERLPYFFAIVDVPELAAERVGSLFPSGTIQATALLRQAPKVSGKRYLEDVTVEHIIRSKSAAFTTTYTQVVGAHWYVLSARKAHDLLRDLLFDRVYALRVPGFAQQFRGAELDMHFSLSHDLVPLHDFLRTLRDEGLTKVATLMERGEY